MRQSLAVAMAFVGLLVGAGFATGKEMLQYFIAFGSIGLIGVVITGALMAIFGWVVLQVGCYFLADEHGHVFKHIAHPRVSRILDLCVSATMVTMGMMMLAGAGASVKQTFGLPAWAGSAGLAIIVYFVCFLDAEKVSNIIGVVTPLMIVAVIILFVWSLAHIPDDFSLRAASEMGKRESAPVSPWWWSAINCAGMTLMCAIGMSLVIGGTYTKLRDVGIGGLIGGAVIGVMMLMETTSLFINVKDAGGKDIPMAAVTHAINPTAGVVLQIIIVLMIFNTALGDFYAFSRRIEVAFPTHPRVNLAVILTVCWGVSLLGFGPLIQIVFPVLGYVGTFVGIMFVAWRIRWSRLIRGEKERRQRIRQLTRLYIHPRLTMDSTMELNYELENSDANSDKLFTTVAQEERKKLDPDTVVPHDKG
ncbi:hypothetical protein ACGE24_01135 [Corynebacterium kroppenstedtii]|uniref:YkvI family membrane protein n=1 Tax=Corynebacterium sp. PCR 32 TaxID=3351342 RepID=UPI0030B71DEF